MAGVLGAGGGPEPQPGGMKTLSKTDTKNGLDNRGHYNKKNPQKLERISSECNFPQKTPLALHANAVFSSRLISVENHVFIYVKICVN